MVLSTTMFHVTIGNLLFARRSRCLQRLSTLETMFLSSHSFNRTKNRIRNILPLDTSDCVPCLFFINSLSWSQMNMINIIYLFNTYLIAHYNCNKRYVVDPQHLVISSIKEFFQDLTTSVHNYTNLTKILICSLFRKIFKIIFNL